GVNVGLAQVQRDAVGGQPRQTGLQTLLGGLSGDRSEARDPNEKRDRQCDPRAASHDLPHLLGPEAGAGARSGRLIVRGLESVPGALNVTELSVMRSTRRPPTVSPTFAIWLFRMARKPSGKLTMPLSSGRGGSCGWGGGVVAVAGVRASHGGPGGGGGGAGKTNGSRPMFPCVPGAGTCRASVGGGPPVEALSPPAASVRSMMTFAWGVSSR